MSYTYLPKSPEEAQEAYERLADMVEGGEPVLCWVRPKISISYEGQCEFCVNPDDDSEAFFAISSKRGNVNFGTGSREEFISECHRLKVQYPKPNP